MRCVPRQACALTQGFARGGCGAARRLTDLKPDAGARRDHELAMKTRAPQSTGRLDDWRVADAQALRAERQVAQKLKAAAGGAAAPTEAERRHALRLRARANALLGKAIA